MSSRPTLDSLCVILVLLMAKSVNGSSDLPTLSSNYNKKSNNHVNTRRSIKIDEEFNADDEHAGRARHLPVTVGSVKVTAPDTSGITATSDADAPHDGCPADTHYRVQLTIMTDNDPHQTNWEFEHGSNVIMSGGSYTAQQATFQNSFCFDKPGLYKFSIHDDIGDGILTPGGFEVNFDGTVVSGGEFGTLFTETFGDCATSAECSTTVPYDPDVIFSCPTLPLSPSGSSATTIDMGDDVAEPVVLNLAKDAGLCTLSLTDEYGDYLPIARSYDGRNWEVTAGPFNSPSFDLALACDATTCSIDLTSILHTAVGGSGEIRLTSYAPYLDESSSEIMEKKGIVARFLEQATYVSARTTPAGRRLCWK